MDRAFLIDTIIYRAAQCFYLLHGAVPTKALVPRTFFWDPQYGAKPCDQDGMYHVIVSHPNPRAFVDYPVRLRIEVIPHDLATVVMT